MFGDYDEFEGGFDRIRTAVWGTIEPARRLHPKVKHCKLFDVRFENLVAK